MSVCNDEDIYSPIEQKYDPNIDVKCGKKSFDIVDKCCMKIIERANTGDHWNKIVERDVALTKFKYPFLSDKQIRGKVLQKLGIPNYMGDIIRTGANRVTTSLAKTLGVWKVKKEAKVPPPFRMLRKPPAGLMMKREIKKQSSPSPPSQSPTSSTFTLGSFDEDKKTDMKTESPSYIPDILLRKRPPSVDSTENDEELSQIPVKKRKLKQNDLQRVRREWSDTSNSTAYCSESQGLSQNPVNMVEKHVTWSDSSSIDSAASLSRTPDEIRDHPNKWSQGSVLSLSSPDPLTPNRIQSDSQEIRGILKTPVRTYGQSMDSKNKDHRNLTNNSKKSEAKKLLSSVAEQQNFDDAEISRTPLSSDCQNSSRSPEISQNSSSLEILGNNQNFNATNRGEATKEMKDVNDLTLTPIENSPRISLDSHHASIQYSPAASMPASNFCDKENQESRGEQDNLSESPKKNQQNNASSSIEIITQEASSSGKIPVTAPSSRIIPENDDNLQLYGENSQIFVKRSLPSSSHFDQATKRQKTYHRYTQIVVADVEREDSYDPDIPVNTKSTIINRNTRRTNDVRDSNSIKSIGYDDILPAPEISVSSGGRRDSRSMEIEVVESSEIIQVVSPISIALCDNIDENSNISTREYPKSPQNVKERTSLPTTSDKTNAIRLAESDDSIVKNSTKIVEEKNINNDVLEAAVNEQSKIVQDDFQAREQNSEVVIQNKEAQTIKNNGIISADENSGAPGVVELIERFQITEVPQISTEIENINENSDISTPKCSKTLLNKKQMKSPTLVGQINTPGLAETGNSVEASVSIDEPVEKITKAVREAASFEPKNHSLQQSSSFHQKELNIENNVSIYSQKSMELMEQ